MCNGSKVAEVLKQLPAAIKQAEEELLEVEESLASLSVMLDHWELGHLREITEAVGEDGKPVHSNDAKRKAELEARKRHDEEYGKLNERRKELLHGVGLKKIEVRFQANRLRVGEALVALASHKEEHDNL